VKKEKHRAVRGNISQGQRKREGETIIGDGLPGIQKERKNKKGRRRKNIKKKMIRP